MSSINSRNRNKKRQSMRRDETVAEKRLSLIHTDLNDVKELSRAQMLKFIPEVPDVPRIRFSRRQIVNAELSYSQSVALSTTAPTNTSLQFSLSQGDNYASFTGAFDQYRIIQVSVKITDSPLSAGSSGNLLSVIDYDDANALSLQANYLGYNTLKITPIGQIDERILTPRLAVAAYSGSAFSSFANMGQIWLDSASPTIPYYGLKVYAPTSPVNNTVMFYVTMMVQFRSQRSNS